MAKTFTITDEQLAKLREFRKNHRTPKKTFWLLAGRCILAPGTIGDLGHYHITPSGIGDFISYHCACGAECDLNDYEYF